MTRPQKCEGRIPRHRRRRLGAVLSLWVLLLTAAAVSGFGGPLYAWKNYTGVPGGIGNADGPGSAARFNFPSGVAVDSATNVYVADYYNHTIRKVTRAGIVTTLAGCAGQFGTNDGVGSAARFCYPAGVAVDTAGSVYVADSGNHTIREVTSAGVVTTLAGNPGDPGADDGTNDVAQFNVPLGVAVDNLGDVYVADSGNHTIRKVTSTGVVTTLAGDSEESGTNDGTAGAARFSYPASVAVDSAGNVYVADLDNNTIRKVTSEGVVTTLAGSPEQFGSANGLGSSALFDYPSGVAVDGAGNVYVTDSGNDTIRMVSSTGLVTTPAGNPGQSGSADGTGSAANFSSPSGVAADAAGNVYVADFANDAIRIMAAGGVVTTLAGSAPQPGSADTHSAALFNHPTGVAVDRAGNVYVADSDNETIRLVTSAGAVTTLAGSPEQAGNINGAAGSARFNYPAGVALDPAGNVYVADLGNNSLRKITNGGFVTTLAGSAARLDDPSGVAVDSAGNVYVADSGNDTIQKVTGAGVVTTLAGNPREFGTNDGAGSAAEFNLPLGVAVDGAGNVYVADYYNDTIRKITSAGVVTTLAGSPTQSGTNDGTGTAARFTFPRGVAVDDAGNIYVADSGNHTIRKVSSGGVVTTMAGTPGQSGFGDGQGSAAQFNYPSGVAVDGAGNVYVADLDNDTIRVVTAGGLVATLAGSPEVAGNVDAGSVAQYFGPSDAVVDRAANLYVADKLNHTIRRVTPGGMVTTLAGSAGQPGAADGTGAAAQFDYPSGLALDTAGNLYVADELNCTIRKVTIEGVVTTLAGSPGQFGSADGPGQGALFSYPSGVAVDGATNIYVADEFNHTIRKITSAGTVTTLAGAAGEPGSADGQGRGARFSFPSGVAVDSAGNVYVADSGNSTIRKVTRDGTVTTLAGSAGEAGTNDGGGSGARFNLPRGVTVDSAGNVYVADTGNGTLRMVTSAGVVTTIGGAAGVIGGVDGVGGSANFSAPTGVSLDASGCLYVADSGNNRISVGTPGPALNISFSASGIILSWPSPFTNFLLQENSDLRNTSGWTTGSDVISNDGKNQSITILSPTGKKFFRLVQP